MARRKNQMINVVREEAPPTVINLLQLTAKIAETQGFEAWEIVNVVNSVLHFPLDIEFNDRKEANG